MRVGKRALGFCLCLLLTVTVHAEGADGSAGRQTVALVDRTIALVEKAGPVSDAVKEKARQLSQPLTDASTAPRRKQSLIKQLKRLRREILFSHPGLAFDDLLINCRNRRLPNHMVDHYLAKGHRPGSGPAILRKWKQNPKAERIVQGEFPKGAYFHPDLSYDAQRILFSFSPDVPPDQEVETFHIYEINVDGSGLRQLTGTASDAMRTKNGRRTHLIEDWDPCYLPGGEIVFTSSRLNGHIRCAYGCRYNPTFGLHKMNADGREIRQLTYGDVAEYDPVVMPDGRLVYTRWDYVDRHDTFFQGLWRINPDGTQTGHVYGNASRAPCVVTQAKPVPGRSTLMALAAPHHGQFLGTVILIDPARGEDGLEPITRLTPDVGFPEAGAGSRSGRYATPWPVTEDLFFVSYLDDSRELAIYLIDRAGGRELIYRAEGESCYSPIPLMARRAPLPRPDLVEGRLDKRTGIYYVSNVYESRHDIRGAGEVKYLRVNQLFDQAAQIAPGPSRVMNAMPTKILGEAPVDVDGSVCFEAPAKEMLSLQLLDAERKAIMGMRTFIYLQPGEVTACVGCHEQRSTAPPASPLGQVEVQTLTPPPGTDYAGGFSFPKSVQPILDRHCISCHGLKEKADGGLDLVGRPSQIRAPRGYGAPGMKTIWAPASYFNLTKYARIAEVNEQTFVSKPKDYYAHQAKLLPILEQHKMVSLSQQELQTIIRWLDLNCICHGDWSWNRDAFRGYDPEGWQALKAELALQYGASLDGQPFDAWVNRASLPASRALKLGLATAVGGWADQAPLWTNTDDPAYRRMINAVNGAVQPPAFDDEEGTCGRGTRNGCICGSCWVRECFAGDQTVLKVANARRQLKPAMKGHEALPTSPSESCSKSSKGAHR